MSDIDLKRMANHIFDKCEDDREKVIKAVSELASLCIVVIVENSDKKEIDELQIGMEALIASLNYRIAELTRKVVIDTLFDEEVKDGGSDS